MVASVHSGDLSPTLFGLAVLQIKWCRLRFAGGCRARSANVTDEQFAEVGRKLDKLLGMVFWGFVLQVVLWFVGNSILHLAIDSHHG